MALFEDPEATWDKRFKQRHYSYRDSEAHATALTPGMYTFGTNARAISIFNWPNMGDYASGTAGPRGQCYARQVSVYVTQDTWITFISLNPIYLTLLAQNYTAAQIAAMGVPLVITEVEHFVAANARDTFYPTYASIIVYRTDTVDGMIYVSAEGNVEGGE